MSLALRSPITPTWCPGCNNFVLYSGIQQAITALNIPQKDVVLVFDIGCVGNMADFFSTYGLHTLHGRSVPTALGVKLQNPNLHVIVVGGDGGIYGEGLNHVIAAARLDANITVLVANNELYSLTTGQTSPTTPHGSKTKSTPHGAPYRTFDPVSTLKQINPEADIRSLDGKNPLEITTAIKEALITPHFSLLDLRQVCVTFGRQITG